MRVKFVLNTGYVGSKVEEIFEFEDYYTKFDLEEEYQAWIWEKTGGSWSILDD